MMIEKSKRERLAREMALTRLEEANQLNEQLLTTQHELYQQRQFLKQVVDMNPNLIFARNQEGEVTLVNNVVTEKFGINIEQVGFKRIAYEQANVTAVLAQMRAERSVQLKQTTAAKVSAVRARKTESPARLAPLQDELYQRKTQRERVLLKKLQEELYQAVLKERRKFHGPRRSQQLPGENSPSSEQ